VRSALPDRVHIVLQYLSLIRDFARVRAALSASWHRIILSRIPHHTLSQFGQADGALGSIGSALVLVGLKVFLAVATGSLGVLSEALHSGLDLVAAILTWFSVACLLIGPPTPAIPTGTED